VHPPHPPPPLPTNIHRPFNPAPLPEPTRPRFPYCHRPDANSNPQSPPTILIIHDDNILVVISIRGPRTAPKPRPLERHHIHNPLRRIEPFRRRGGSDGDHFCRAPRHVDEIESRAGQRAVRGSREPRGSSIDPGSGRRCWARDVAEVRKHENSNPVDIYQPQLKKMPMTVCLLASIL
jgi:hypothetical protein